MQISKQISQIPCVKSSYEMLHRTAINSLIISEISGFLEVVLTLKMLIEKRKHM